MKVIQQKKIADIKADLGKKIEALILQDKLLLLSEGASPVPTSTALYCPSRELRAPQINFRPDDDNVLLNFTKNTDKYADVYIDEELLLSLSQLTCSHILRTFRKGLFSKTEYVYLHTGDALTITLMGNPVPVAKLDIFIAVPTTVCRQWKEQHCAENKYTTETNFRLQVKGKATLQGGCTENENALVYSLIIMPDDLRFMGMEQ